MKRWMFAFCSVLCLMSVSVNAEVPADAAAGADASHAGQAGFEPTTARPVEASQDRGRDNQAARFEELLNACSVSRDTRPQESFFRQGR